MTDRTHDYVVTVKQRVPILKEHVRTLARSGIQQFIGHRLAECTIECSFKSNMTYQQAAESLAEELFNLYTFSYEVIVYSQNKRDLLFTRR